MKSIITTVFLICGTACILYGGHSIAYDLGKKDGAWVFLVVVGVIMNLFGVIKAFDD